MFRMSEARNSLSQSVRKRINNEIHDLTTNTYFREIPLGDISEILEKYDVLLLQEDFMPWSGFLMGTDEQVNFTLGDKNQIKDNYGKDSRGEDMLAYEPFTNAMLAMSWYKMGSGKYEIVAYIS